MGEPETEAERIATERAMMRIEAEADVWLAETPDIGRMVRLLGDLAPPPFRNRARGQVDALVRQTFVEAFYRGFNLHKDGAAAVASQSPPANTREPSDGQ